MSLNRQPGDLVQHELAALTQIAKGTDIVSKDGEPVGQATKLHERKEDIDPAAKLYQFYFRVARPTMGTPLVCRPILSKLSRLTSFD